jgi:hypothetical protein
MMEFSLFALLPLALASLFDRETRKGHSAGFLPLLAALAPVIAKGVGNLIGGKQKKAAAKQAEEQKKLEAQQADTLARQQWDTQQNSPAAQAARFKNTMQLGRLGGAMGGIDKIPPSIAKYYQSQRAMPEYTGTSSYVPTAEKGGGGWDFLGGVTDALSYLDTSKLGGPKASVPLMSAGNVAAGQGGLGALQGAGPATALQGLTDRLKGGVYKPVG